jgi:GNAT superfamily N-acetyltransferase
VRGNGIRPQGPHEVYLDPARRASLLALLDDGFPKLSSRIAAAAAEGYRWEDVTEPFVAWEGADAIGHVGVLVHRVQLAGAPADVAGLHAVVTRADRRGRGVARRLLAEALAWADARFPRASLATDVPAVYAPHGFRPFVIHRFHVAHAGGEDRGRRLSPSERPWLDALLAARAPISHRLASLNPGWLVGIDLALQGRAPTDLVVLDDLGAAVDWELAGDVLRLHDVFARELPPLADLLARAPRHARVELGFCPDRLAPDARPEPDPAAGVWMFRGPWPLEPPIAVSRLAEH